LFNGFGSALAAWPGPTDENVVCFCHLINLHLFLVMWRFLLARTLSLEKLICRRVADPRLSPVSGKLV